MNEYLIRLIPDILKPYVTDSVANNLMLFGLSIVLTMAYLAALFLVAVLLRRLNKKLFSYLTEKKGKKTHLLFLEGFINAYIIIIAIIIPLAGDSLKKSLLGSAAVVTAVLGFAGQDIIKDMLAGLLISIYKPFDIGDRIALEDGTIGIVESVTLHHVVLLVIDTQRVVIPNSKINNAGLVNYSFDYVDRSIFFKFPVAYDSDLEKTKTVIMDCVMASPYSDPGKRGRDGKMSYASVYFLEMADSALIMAVTVYYKPTVPTEVVRDDINTRVFKALGEAGIEIPYAYTNVVIKKDADVGE